jgi:hypothetical protein
MESELTTALALLIGVLALAVRVLLLLAGLLAAALLLLAGFLTRVLVLLARILVRIGHRDLPLLNVTSVLNVTVGNNREIPNWFQGKSGSIAIIDDGGRLGRPEPKPKPPPKLPMYKPFKPHGALLPPRGTTVRKT